MRKRIKDANFFEKLKQTRIAMGLTRLELAEKLGVSIKTIKQWEDGVNVPHKKYYDIIFSVLKIKLEG